jgi:uncharacterized protein
MQETSMKDKFISFIVNKPKRSICLSLVFLFVVAAGLKNLTPNFSYRIWFSDNSKALQIYDKFESRFGSDETVLLMLESPSGVFDKSTASTIIKMTEALWLAPDVIRVTSLSNFNWTHALGDDIEVEPLIPDDMELTPELLATRKKIAINHRSIKNYLVSADGTVALFYLKLKPFMNMTPDYEKITNGIRNIVSKFENKEDHNFYLAGNIILNHSFKESTQADLGFLIPLVLLMATILLGLNLRSLGGVIQSLIIIFASIILTMGAAGWMGFEINNLTGMVPQFMIAIGIADSVHLLVTFFVFRKKGIQSKEAVRLSLVKNFRPTILTSFSTAFGFFSFASAGIAPISSMGIIAGFGALLAWLISYLLLGPLMLSLKYNPKESMQSNIKLTPSVGAYAVADLINKYRFLIVSFFILVSIFNIYYITKIEVDSDPVAYFDKSFHLRKATDFVEEHVGGAMAAEIVIESGKEEGIKDPQFLAKVDELQTWISEKPFISKTTSIIDVLKDINKSLNGGDDLYYKLPTEARAIAQQLLLYSMSVPQGMDLNDRMTIKNDALKITAMWTLHKSSEILEFAQKIRDKASSLGLAVDVTGKSHLWQTINKPIVNSFITSITIAIVLISILLCFGLGSVKIGLFSMIPNTLPLLFGGGLISLLGKYLDIGTVIVGSICLGIAVDDTIHFVSNFINSIKQGKNIRESIAYIFMDTAPALITTTIVLVISFGTFVFGTFVPNQNFGILVSLVLSFALISDLIFLPAILFIVGEDFFKKK